VIGHGLSELCIVVLKVGYYARALNLNLVLFSSFSTIGAPSFPYSYPRLFHEQRGLHFKPSSRHLRFPNRRNEALLRRTVAFDNARPTGGDRNSPFKYVAFSNLNMSFASSQPQRSLRVIGRAGPDQVPVSGVTAPVIAVCTWSRAFARFPGSGSA
jgi:hypothetical protein